MSDDVDLRTRELLALLDPGARDPGYWPRFQRWVVTSAGPELARRRRVAAVSVSDVVLSWWRTLVPATLVVALLAGTLLLRDRSAGTAPAVAYVDMDEILMEGVEAPEMPSFEMAVPDGTIELVNEIF